MHFVLEAPERSKKTADRRVVSSAAAASAWASKIINQRGEIPGTAAWLLNAGDRTNAAQKTVRNRGRPTLGKTTKPGLWPSLTDVNVIPTCLARGPLFPKALKHCQSATPRRTLHSLMVLQTVIMSDP